MPVEIAVRSSFLLRLMRVRNNSRVAINTTSTLSEFLWNALRGILEPNAHSAAHVFIAKSILRHP